MPFINTVYTDAIKAFTKTNIDLLENPMYKFNDKNATVVDYYNKDINLSTLDESSGLEYDIIGEDCPSKFNLIKDALLYGIEKVQFHYETNEDGTYGDDITGDAYVLPDTFEPQVGDYFIIKYLKEHILFIVTEIQIDTLDNGNNFWKISYKSEHTGAEALKIINKFNLADSFNMISSTIGTNMKCIIKSTDYDFLTKIETNTLALKEYYKQVFFKNPIQTFSYILNGIHIYDPYLIEFMIRNKTLAGTRDYIYIDHAMNVWTTFGIDYDHTFFRALELKSKDKADKCNTLGVATIVDDSLSLLTTRLEPYFYMDYKIRDFAPFATKIEVIPNDFIDDMIQNRELNEKFPKFFKIVSDYFNDVKFTEKDLNLLDDIDFYDNKELFYFVPMIIFVLEQRVEEVLKRIDVDENRKS